MKQVNIVTTSLQNRYVSVPSDIHRNSEEKRARAWVNKPKHIRH